jgi:hypothetical protein
MKGDFSRISFDPANRFSRVLTQQGRVTLDADFNEQADILLHTLRMMARDLFGPFGGPAIGGGFGLSFHPPSAATNLNLSIGSGHYYVDGILCESEGCDYANQPDYKPSDGDPLLTWLKNPGEGDAFWIYLDVWERHITWIEQDSIREAALGVGGPDTCTRSKVVWQVKARPWDTKNWDNPPSNAVGVVDRTAGCTRPFTTTLTPSTAQMAARLDPGQQLKDPCTISPDAKYRGAENQLYRVEVHHGGTAGDATFKWSRDNGSVATRWLGTEGNDLIVANARGFTAGSRVELSDDTLDLNGESGQLVKLAKVEGDRLSVDPASIPASGSIAWTAQLSDPTARRWDQSENDHTTLDDGAVPIVESVPTDPANPANPNPNPTWIDLEDGIQVWFASGGTYHSGDYWLIPARVATGSIEWEPEQGSLKAPQGVKHHYAPLGIIHWITGNSPGGNSGQDSIHGCRVCKQIPQVSCPSLLSEITVAPRPVPVPLPVRPRPATKAKPAAAPTKAKKTGRR